MAPKCTGWRRANEMFDLVDYGDRVVFGQKPDVCKYNHWGIVVAKHDEDRSVDIIHYTGPNIQNAVIREDRLEVVANGDKCAVDNSLDSRRMPYLSSEIVQRARSRLGEATYDPVTNNCEQFASWCRNGIQHSGQVRCCIS